MLKSLSVSDWSPSDRAAWDAACRPAVRLRRGGSAARLAPVTRDDLQKRYGYFLTFLKERGRFDDSGSCATLLTPANVHPFVDRMRNEWSATTLFMTIQKLKQIARHLAPAENFKWLADIAGDLKAEDGPIKRSPAVDASELLIAGLSLVEEYAEPGKPMSLDMALNIRNGLMTALLASCPIRAKNLAGLTLGQSLRLSGSCWWIDLPGSETKSGRPDSRMIPEFLTSALETYLRQARPFLLTRLDPRDSTCQKLPHHNGLDDELVDEPARICLTLQKAEAAVAAMVGAREPDEEAAFGKLSGPLWISRDGHRITYSSIHNIVTSVTEATIGAAISPHGFRYAAATTAAWKAGNLPNLAAGLLQHQDRRITDASYIRATSFEAAQHFGTLLRRR
jgi:integrase